MSWFIRATGAMVDRIKINALTRESRDGRGFWIKRRRWSAGATMACANRFFQAVGNPVQALTDVSEWQAWEVNCFLGLHGDTFLASAEGAHSVAAEEVPGENLSEHLDKGSLDFVMLSAAARELRRAHAMKSAYFTGAWSHGDPHAGNFVFDANSNRARLIDFEVRHHRGLREEERQADDLLVFLQDIAGRLAADQWLPSAQAFLESYGNARVLARLRERLVVPRGLARIWWAVRTTYLAQSELERRVAELRAII